MVLLDRKIRKANLEIQLLERQLRWVHNVNMLMIGTIYKF